MKNKIKFIIALATMVTGIYANEPKTVEVVKLKWLVAHSPNNYFIEMAKYFKKRVEKETENRVQIEIIDDFTFESNSKQKKLRTNLVIANRVSSKNYIKNEKIKGINSKVLHSLIKENKTGGEVFANRLNAFKLMVEGKIDMAQGYTYFLARVGNPMYHTLELPFLFDDYTHIDKFFESEDGEKLLASTSETYGYRGLGYTFSGGLLQTISRVDNPMLSKGNWNGKRFRSTGSIIRNDFLQELGAELTFVHKSKETLVDIKHRIIRPPQLINENLIDIEEINLPDVELFFAKSSKDSSNLNQLKRLTVTETKHVLLSTVFLINEKSYQKMSVTDQAIVKKIAVDAAKFERNLTITRYENAKRSILARGLNWNTLPEKNREELKLLARPVYQRLYDKVPTSKTMVENINLLRKADSKKLLINTIK